MAYEISLAALTQKLNKSIVEALRAGVPPEICGAALGAAQRYIDNATPLIKAANEGVRRTEGTPT